MFAAFVLVPALFSGAQPIPFAPFDEGGRRGYGTAREEVAMPAASIGVARMENDGTIVLQLRAEGPGGVAGDVLFRYPPGHPQYQEILRHVGGLENGQSKPVPPWPEKSRQKSADREAEPASNQVLVDTFRSLVRYALLKTHGDVMKLGVTPAEFSVAALDESLQARANAGVFGQHAAPSLQTLLKSARQRATFHFYWKAPSGRDSLEAVFALSYEPDGDLKVRLMWLAVPEHISIAPAAGPSGGPRPFQEAVAELLRVLEDGRLAPYPSPK